MSVDLVVDPGPFRWRVGRIDDGGLSALRVVDVVAGIEDGVFKARVTAAAPELGGVFCDLGRADGVFVRLPRRLRHPPPVLGAALMVQGVRDTRRSKAGRASPNVRLAGALLEWWPGAAGPGLVEGLPPARAKALRERLQVLPAAAPVALTAAALDATDAEIEAEAFTLEGLWARLEERFEVAGTPAALLTEDEQLSLAMRGLGRGTGRVVTTPEFGLWVGRISQASGVDAAVITSALPWAEAGCEGALAGAAEPVVPLVGGGALVIEHTQAFVAVDVDRGAATGPAAAVNARAIDALAEAIRVRELGGQIVVDFLEPAGEGGRVALSEAVSAELASTGAQLVALLASGLCVLERPQRRIALVDRADPTVEAAEELLRRASGQAVTRAAVAPDVDALLRRKGYAEASRRWLERVGSRLDAERDATLERASYVIREPHR